MWKSLVLLVLFILLSPSLCRSFHREKESRERVKSPRRLAAIGKRFVNEFEFAAWHWPPKRPQFGNNRGRNVDYKYNEEGDKQWFEDFDAAVDEFERISKKIDEVEKAVDAEEDEGLRLYRHPARPYPLCVDGFKPLLHELEDPDVWAKSQEDMINPKYNYVLDDLYHWMPIFSMLSPPKGIHDQGWNINLMNPPSTAGQILHRISANEGAGPFIIHCKRHYLETSRPSETVFVQTVLPSSDTFEGMSSDIAEKYHYLPNWFHIQCQTFKNFRLEGLLIQAVSYPNGLPFGKFVDSHDCHTDDFHQINARKKNYFPDIRCYRDPRTFDWLEETPEKSKRIHNVIPCKYNHGNNNGDFYPTVWAFGGNKWTIPKPKFGTFRTLFTYTSLHCNHKLRMNFLVIAVRSFINALFDVYISASFPLQPHDQSFTTPPLIASWNFDIKKEDDDGDFKHFLTCNKLIEQPGFEGSGNAGSLKIFDELDNWGKFEWEDAGRAEFTTNVKTGHKPFTAFFIYDRDYDDCIRDTTNARDSLDSQRNCPPKNICLNLEHDDMTWDKSERRRDVLSGFFNPISIHRFDRYWIQKNQHTRAMNKLINDQCNLKRCLHPRFTIPILKMYETPAAFNKHCSHDFFASESNRHRRRRRSLPGSQSRNQRQRQIVPSGDEDKDGLNDDSAVEEAVRGEVNPVVPHRFSEELTRGMFILYNAFVKKSIITHAWMMVFAWFILLTVGTFTSRYYKETAGTGPFEENSMMGIGAWIWIHVILLLLSMMFMWMGVQEVAHFRRHPNSCNMFESFQDLSLKNYCRWRKQSVRYHQILGYVSLVLFHVSFFFAWSRPAKAWNLRQFKFTISINWRIIFVYIHVFAAYGGKFFAVASVMAFWDPRAFSVCKDIPILVIIIEIVSIIFFIIGWVVQFLEDRNREDDEYQMWMKKWFPVLEAWSADGVPWFGCKLALMISSVVVHLALFMIVCISLDMVFGKDGQGADQQGEFEIRHGIFGTCNVTSRDSVMRAMIGRYYSLQSNE